MVFRRDKTIYVGTNDQHIDSLNAETGAVISEIAAEAKPVGRLAFSNDSLFVFLQNASSSVALTGETSVNTAW